MAIGSVRAFRAPARGERAELVAVEAPIPGDGEVAIGVAYSSLNYKDALALTATAPVVRRYPLVCGIDLAGVVTESRAPGFSVGDEVIATGYGLGEERDGGLAERAVAPAYACIHLPAALDLRRAMAIGTAGLSAMLAVLALEHDLGASPPELPTLVTGATGGVGSVAVMSLHARGWPVVASTGKASERPFLEMLGADEVIDRHELEADAPGALSTVRFGAAVDVVGGATLANVVAQLAPGGSVAVLGLAGSPRLEMTVYPLILRGVILHGVNAVRPTRELLERAWRSLAEELPLEQLDALTSVVSFEDAPAAGEELLAGRVRGRTVVAIGAD